MHSTQAVQELGCRFGRVPAGGGRSAAGQAEVRGQPSSGLLLYELGSQQALLGKLRCTAYRMLCWREEGSKEGLVLGQQAGQSLLVSKPSSRAAGLVPCPGSRAHPAVRSTTSLSSVQRRAQGLPVQPLHAALWRPAAPHEVLRCQPGSSLAQQAARRPGLLGGSPRGTRRVRSARPDERCAAAAWRAARAC